MIWQPRATTTGATFVDDWEPLMVGCVEVGRE